MVKEFLKRSFPKLYSVYSIGTKILRNNLIKNYFNSTYDNAALLSYILKPFTSENNFRHTNYFTALSIARILDENGYRVDIVDFRDDRYFDFTKYNVLVGFGEAFKRYFDSGHNHVKTIFYGTGMHVCHQNNVTLQRLKDVYQKKGEWITQSTRFVEKTWSHQTMLVDGIIALGNAVCKASYEKYYDGIIISVPNTYYKTCDGYQMIADRKKNKYNNVFLWFGSSGLIHKGLDIVLEAFVNKPEALLHVSGPIDNEPAFKKLYQKELFQTPNIITHGFVDITSERFFNILRECCFSIYPSCSEGGSPSLLTTIGNGALIPIITKETTVSTGSEIWIEEFTTKSVEQALSKALELDKNEIYTMQKDNLDYVCRYHSQENYFRELKRAIELILRN